MATEMELMTVDKPEDPDAQATITDFLDYTEYLPSDLNRSLNLIGKLDESYLGRAGTVHELTRQYGMFPKLSQSDRPDLNCLRTQISYNLDYAISARESALGEATRLYEMVDRHYNRLASIKSKLKALPKPPSRDPTPVPRSPQATRKSPPPRITLRLDGPRPPTSAGRAAERALKSRYRDRKVTIPGEVLPPPNLDSPISFTASDWESIPPSPLAMPTSRVGGSRKQPSKPVRIRPPKQPKPPKQLKDRTPRQPRPPGMGTNVHSAVAGISTSNALSLLPAPPPDAKPGSEHAPWMRLTEWEMAKLRKRMKKNAIWTPSETMIRRELADAGRGPDNYRLKKTESEARGEEFIDVDEIATTAPGKPLAPGEISADSLGLADTNLSNRGMKLNEAKKLKREAMKEASYKEAEEVAKRLGDIGSSFKELFSKRAAAPVDSALATTSVPNGNQFQRERSSKKDRSAQKENQNTKESVRTHGEKRKRDETPKLKVADFPSEAATSPSKPANKKQKTSQAQATPSTITTNTITTTVPLAAPAPSSSKPPSRRSKSVTPATPSMAAPEKPKISTAPSKTTATSSRPRRVSLTLKGPANPSPQTAQPSPLGSSRAASRRGSTGPPSATLPREHLRRKSATPAPPASPAAVRTAASRRSKRPAPGAVVQNQEGGAAVSVGTRRHAPPKLLLRPSAPKASDNANSKEQEAVMNAEDDVDPDEPRYCYCGDVSYGEMVACENDNVSQCIPRQSALMRKKKKKKKKKMMMMMLISEHLVRAGMVPFRVCGPAGEPPKADEVVLPGLPQTAEN